MATIAERLAEFQAKRAQLLEQKQALVKGAMVDEGRSLDEHEQEQDKQFQADIKACDDAIVTLTEHEKLMLTKATPVTPASGRGEGAVEIPGSGPISVRRNLPKGTSFTRYAMALAASRGNLTVAERIAENKFKDTPEVAMVLKTATQEGTTADATWAGPLVYAQDMASEFIELLRAETILGRLPALRRVPFNIRMARQTAGTTGTFVGEGLPTPVRELAFDTVTLPYAKCSTICVISAELARFSDPSAEARVRMDLIQGIAEYLDKRLIDPAYAGVASVSPASLTNGVTPTTSTGSTIAALDANWRSVMSAFASTNQRLSDLIVVMSPAQAIRFSMMRTNQDFALFPGMTMAGGTMYGLPVITSNNVSPSGSPGDEHIIFIDQGEVLMADDGQITLDVSAEASLEFNDAPSGGATSLRSLWQNGLVGVMANRWIYWTKRRSTAVKYIDKAQSYAS
jgi:HK97 family phage major capsid protein